LDKRPSWPFYKANRQCQDLVYVHRQHSSFVGALATPRQGIPVKQLTSTTSRRQPLARRRRLMVLLNLYITLIWGQRRESQHSCSIRQISVRSLNAQWQSSFRTYHQHIHIRLQMWKWWSFFRCSKVDRVTISNPESLSSGEAGVNQGLRSWKKALTWTSSTSESRSCYLFQRQWRAVILQPGLEFDSFKHWLKRGIFKYISWLNGSFLGVMIGVFWKRGQDLWNGNNIAS
jgi:hypothetical protein